ncbi:MAG: CoB--CoM heterodisulfide reductase iron-sulfur subunit A family protein [Candidatus Helarchaeota archaeon]|nr:CoB--CoM heterodisulfide reductase iron-sulfur subunit A family protein [Candidatus Helarchaeota archaeon]
MNFDVAIIGGGIAGTHAAIELSDLGYSAIIIEKSPSLGGKAAQLGKFFPTNDCALCFSVCTSMFKSRGFRKCLYRSNLERNPLIKILTLSEVAGVEGTAGNFTVKVKKQPRHVNENCIGCLACIEACPIEVPNEFNYGWNTRKVIYLPFPMAVPHWAVINRAECRDCSEECVAACPTDAINLNAAAEDITINAKAIVVATGFEELDPSIIKEYGYGIYDNVITQIQLARMLDPTGPSKGVPILPSSGEPVKTVTIALCVGSRDSRYKEYCSRICCTYSLKHALMLREKGVEVRVCYMDIRTFGEYENYYIRCREEGVTFLRGRLAGIEEDPVTKKLFLNIENTITSEFISIEEELVVLTPGLIPTRGSEKVAELLKLKVDENGFFMGDLSKFSQIETEIPGIFIAGTAESPKDIPDSITQANATAIKINKTIK